MKVTLIPFLCIIPATIFGQSGKSDGRFQEQRVSFNGLKILVSPGVKHIIKAEPAEITLWNSELAGGIVVVRRTPWPSVQNSPRKAMAQLFIHHSKSINKQFPDAKFLGPAAYFRSKTLEFYGGSWRRKDKTMISLVFTWVGSKAFMVMAKLPSTASKSETAKQARKSLQDGFGSIEKN